MALTDDQKAMLRLLAQREEGYEDMAALMGVSVEEVRERVKEALVEVDEEAEPSPGPSEAAPPPPAPPEPPRTEDRPPPPAPSQPRRASGPPKLSLPRPKLPQDRGPAVGIAAGALVVVALVIILIVGGSGGGSSPSAGVESGEGGEQQLTAAEEKNLTQAVLSPVDGGEGSGRALFGRYRKKVLLQVEAQNLEPSAKGQTYTVWLYRSPKLALQIGSVPVGSDGKIAAQFQIPSQLLAYIANGAFDQIDVSLTPTAEYQAAFQKAKGERKLPPHVGESVLRGEITGPAIK